jgi:ATP-dependent helicase/nuclease subunit B
LRKKVQLNLEDTQLAFYGVLLSGGHLDPNLKAMYLALDGDAAPAEMHHTDVSATAATLLAGLADEWQRLRDGAALLALGQDPVCDTCEARGLCRRDHWQVE